jgi:putative methyltransferase
MNSKKKQLKKDSYGRYVENEDFATYWSNEDELLDLSLKQSRIQKQKRNVKHNVYLFEIEDIYANQAKLPYRTGLIWSHCITNPVIKSFFNLDQWFWYRDKTNTMDSMFEKIVNPKFVAFSSFVWNWKWNVEMMKRIKAKWPECVILVGGWQPPTADRSQGFFKKYPFVDIISHGEGEITIEKILIELLGPNPNFKRISGCSVRDKNNETFVTSDRERIQDIHSMPSPYLNGLFDTLIKDCPYQLEATIETTRGCPYSCTFCEIGSDYYKKIKVHKNNKVFAEIDWLAKNKVLFVYNADSNFGMVPAHEAIVNYMVAVKNRTGYPDKHRADWSKVHNDRIVSMAKKFTEADMDKGITLALQSLNTHTLEAIKRVNMDDNKLKNFLKTYGDAGVPSYVELILGLPEETKESFKNGVLKIMEYGQHNYIGIYPLTALPNTPLNDKEYIKEYNLKIIETYPAFSHIDVSDQNEFEVSKMVVGHNNMSYQDYKDLTIWRWMIMFAHFLGYYQYIARFMYNHKGMSYKTFYEKLYKFMNTNHTHINQEMKQTQQSLDIVLAGKGPWGRVVDTVKENFAWDFEEATAIQTLLKYDAHQIDVANFLDMFDIDTDVKNELQRFQDLSIVNPTRQYPIDLNFEYNIYDVIFLHKKLIRKKHKIKFTAKNFDNNIVKWATESLWWGRRRAENKCKIDLI